MLLRTRPALSLRPRRLLLHPQYCPLARPRTGTHRRRRHPDQRIPTPPRLSPGAAVLDLPQSRPRGAREPGASVLPRHRPRPAPRTHRRAPGLAHRSLGADPRRSRPAPVGRRRQRGDRRPLVYLLLRHVRIQHSRQRLSGSRAAHSPPGPSTTTRNSRASPTSATGPCSTDCSGDNPNSPRPTTPSARPPRCSKATTSSSCPNSSTPKKTS